MYMPGPRPAARHLEARAMVATLAARTVFVPCRLDRRDARTALIDDADGWPRRVVGPVGRVGRRLVVAGAWLREAAGRHRVRFGDGAEVWVTYGPGRAEDFVPLGPPPVPAPSRPGSGPTRPAAGPVAVRAAVGPGSGDDGG
jgi:hypothetical protein